MPSPPATPLPASAKRRRLEASQSSLRKPFRSPLLSRPSDSSPLPRRTPPPTQLSTPIKFPKSSTPTQFPKSSTPIKRRTATPSSAQVEAQKYHTALVSQIRAARTAHDTAAQALALEKSRKDEDLKAQIQKWRTVARGAAEELCAVAGERVNRLGGGGAWREVVGGRRRGWEEDEEKKGGEEGDGGGYWERGGEEELGEYGEAVKKKKDEDEEEEWGIGPMLRTLGIPESMLGWDREGECWKDLDETE